MGISIRRSWKHCNHIYHFAWPATARLAYDDAITKIENYLNNEMNAKDVV